METGHVKKETPKILIVDDIDMNVEILQNIISHEGYETLCALSVREAVGLMEKTMPTLILSDLSMPDIDGLEFCRMLKDNPKTRDIPFIFISVLSASEEKERAFLAGAVDFIPKPFDAVEVIMRVNNHLKIYRMKQEMADYNRRMHKLVEEQKKQAWREQENILTALTKLVKIKDPRTGAYLERLGYNCRLLAQSLQFLPAYENEVTNEFVETIEIAVTLHSISNFVLFGDIYDRNDRCGETGRERREEKAEPGTGIAEELYAGQKTGRFLSMALRIGQYCRSKWDGTGDPAAMGKEIPLESRIAVLANDFGRLKDEEGCSAKEAVAKVNERSGSFYEPEIVEVLNRVWRQMKMAPD